MVWITFCVMPILEISGVCAGNPQIASQVAIEAEAAPKAFESSCFQGAAARFAAPTPSNASRNCAAEENRSLGFFSNSRLIRG